MNLDKFKSKEYWKYSKMLMGTDVITKFEREYSLELPKFFKEVLTFANGGRPLENLINIRGEKEYVVLAFLDLNTYKYETYKSIIKEINFEKNNFIFPFAIDPFGNYFCFSYKGNSCEIIFYNHEKRVIEPLTEKIEYFLEKLYK